MPQHPPSRAYDYDSLLTAEETPEPPPVPPKRVWYVVRQESGQLVYKFWEDGKWHARRVPRRIIYKDDAVSWVVENVYGLRSPSADVAREAKLRALIAGTNNPNEREAAERALGKLLAKREAP